MSHLSHSPQVVDRLTQDSVPPEQRRTDLRRFARDNGWRPSDEVLDYPGTESVANGHLVVEHGLENNAVITFLKGQYAFASLAPDLQRRLLSFSYNNLVPWHFFPDRQGSTCVSVLSDPPQREYVALAREPDAWRAEAFERIVHRMPNPNVKSVEDSLISTVSKWKRLLAAENPTATNLHISHLFNTIIFLRAHEDFQRGPGSSTGRLLLDSWESASASKRTLHRCLAKAIRNIGVSAHPRIALGLPGLLSVFDSLSDDTVRALLVDFYENSSAPYPYDFSVMSKHALSRIYEHYVSILRERTSPQLLLFPDLPDEVRNRALGSIYTPQYIARFFVKFLKDNHTPPAFRRLRGADPACGSGMFLRTLLEMQCDPKEDIDVVEVAREAFQNKLGIDVDPNACEASRLSLSLLYLALTGALPKKLSILNKEAINYFLGHLSLRGTYDAVLANPPFISWGTLGTTLRRRISSFMADLGGGRSDMYLAHLRLGMELVKPGGFVLYVLPHSFLVAENARRVRQEISREFFVRFLVDLSQIPVFEDIGSYVILLILQKRWPKAEEPAACIVRCKHYVGHALQDALEGKSTSNDFYTIHDAAQQYFSSHQWRVLHPCQIEVRDRVTRFPLLDNFLFVREGFITGADDIFIRSTDAVPEEERGIYKPYLPDRDMRSYDIPKRTGKMVFYPYVGHTLITLAQLRESFPLTWQYLQKSSARLRHRRSILTKPESWWLPVRPRPPENLLRPKIVSPHLILLPKFSLDSIGKYAVSRCPVIYPRSESSEQEVLRYFTAVLNSSVALWQIRGMSHRYSHGYLMLEPKTLRSIAVPDPAKVEVGVMKKIQALVQRRTESPENTQFEAQLDDLVLGLYGLTAGDRDVLAAEV